MFSDNMIEKISFKGYSNIISAGDVLLGGTKTTYLAMKLDDKNEYKDLTKYKEIRNLLGYSKGLENEDILTLVHVTDGITEDIFLGDRGICTGEQLLYAREKFIPSFFNRKTYRDIVTKHIKIYTFLASLTKRLSNEKFENEDENIKKVIGTIFANMQKLNKLGYCFFDKKEAFELTSVGALKQDKFQKTAKRFNKKIAETMTEFFRYW